MIQKSQVNEALALDLSTELPPGIRHVRLAESSDNHTIAIIAFYSSGIRVPLSGRENHRMELAMPDLDLIKQAEQGARDQYGRFGALRKSRVPTALTSREGPLPVGNGAVPPP